MKTKRLTVLSLCLAALLLCCVFAGTGCSAIQKMIKAGMDLANDINEEQNDPTADVTQPAEVTNAPSGPDVTEAYHETPEPTEEPEPTLPPAPLAFTVGWESPAATGYMLCGAVTQTGELWVWKDGGGHGINYEVVSEQEPVSVMQGVASVYGAGADLLALKKDGTLWFVQSSNLNSPIMIADGVATAAGGGSICAFIRFDGSLFTVMYSEIFRLKEDVVPVKMMDNARAVSCGDNFVAAILTDDTLWTWGNNDMGQLGDGFTADRAVPEKIMDNVKCVDCAARSAVAVNNFGEVYVWGYSGLNTAWEESYHFYETPTLAMSGVVSAVCSESYGRTLMIMKDTGSLWVWSTTPNASGGGFASNSFLLMDGCEHYRFGGGILLLVKDNGDLWVGGYYSHSQNGNFSVLCGDVDKILENTALPD